MPYALRYKGKYLHRQPNATYSRRKRTFVDDITRASTWSEPGHAKNAAREAWDAGVVPKTASLELVYLRLLPTDNVTRIARVRDRYGNTRTRDVV